MLSLGLSLCRPARRGVSLPATIPDLGARYIGDDLIGLIADAAKVTGWSDAAGNTHVAHGTTGNQPVFDEVDPWFNGHASLSFERANSHYLFASTGDVIDYFSGADKPFTAFVVARWATKPASETSETLISLGNSAGTTPLLQCFARHTSGALRARFSANDGGGAVEVNGLNELIDLGPQVHCWGSDGATAKHYLAGASQNPRYDSQVTNITSGSYSAVGSMTFNRFCIGALLRNTPSNYLNCKVAEILIYFRELSARERSLVSDYLFNRYCAAPVTAAFPAKLLSGLTHLWDARSIVADEDAQITSFPPSIGSTFFEAASAGVAPLGRIDVATGVKYLAFDGQDNLMTAGAASDWRFLHDGSDFTLAIVYRVPSTVTTLAPIIDTLANDVANVGFGLYHDAPSGAHSFQAKIGNDTAAVINHDSQDGGSRPAAWHVAIISREGTGPSTEEQYQLYLDNENYAAFDQSATPIGATDPAGTLTLGGLAGGGTFSRIDIQTIAIWNRKLARPDEVQLVNEIFAKALSTSHVALAAGNGLAAILNDATTHRAFPGLVWTDAGRWLLPYRRATTHGASAGVCCVTTSGDGLRWTPERKIFDDSANYDWRGCNALTKLSTGRILMGMTLSATDSTLLPHTSGVLYSDDHGGTWQGPIFVSNLGDTWLGAATMDYDEGVNSIVELGDGSLLGHFMARFEGDSGEATRIAQVRSYDGGLTWTQPQQLYYGTVAQFPQVERIQEPCVVRFADGELLMAIRADVTATNTTGNIYFARSFDNGATWTPGTMTAGDRIDGWGNPRMMLDPSEPDRVWLFHRVATNNVAMWRVSADRGATWSDPEPMSNLSSTTTIQGYTGMTYAYPAANGDGDLFVALGLERQPDGDIFVRRWVNKED